MLSHKEAVSRAPPQLRQLEKYIHCDVCFFCFYLRMMMFYACTCELIKVCDMFVGYI